MHPAHRFPIQIISNTLESMHEHFLFSYLPAGQMRKDNSLSITHNPATVRFPSACIPTTALSHGWSSSYPPPFFVFLSR